MISSAALMVASRWATMNMARPAERPSSASWTIRSELASRLAVASSRSRRAGSRSSERAIAMRWRCPPESVVPCSPTATSYPPASMIKSCALAATAAC
mmetsp:Transcript_31926/g.87440  ORF Transcript_31926/g.87440 Transcript_31926/m.87440 type:complete len:98 (-) Transcript_31926:1835-2128(-)